MTSDVALILGIDGLANGAVYLLAGLGLVLIFSVTRVVFVPFGDVAAFAALSLAAFETGRQPATIGLVATLAVLALAVEVGALCGAASPAHPARAARLGRVAGAAMPGGMGHRRAGGAVAVQVAVAVPLVVPITPLVARIALQPIADASVLVLLIVSLALHFLLSGLGLLFFGPEGSRTGPLVGGGSRRWLSGQRPGAADDGVGGGAERAVLPLSSAPSPARRCARPRSTAWAPGWSGSGRRAPHCSPIAWRRCWPA